MNHNHTRLQRELEKWRASMTKLLQKAYFTFSIPQLFKIWLEQRQILNVEDMKYKETELSAVIPILQPDINNIKHAAQMDTKQTLLLLRHENQLSYFLLNVSQPTHLLRGCILHPFLPFLSPSSPHVTRDTAASMQNCPFQPSQVKTDVAFAGKTPESQEHNLDLFFKHSLTSS